MKNNSKLVNTLLGAMALVLSVAATDAISGTIYSGTLYYTVNLGTPNVNSVQYNYDETQVVLSGNQALGSTTGADGLLFLPDGNLAIGGQHHNLVTELTKSGSSITTATVFNGAYHLALSGDTVNSTLFTMANSDTNGHNINSVNLSSGGLVPSGPITQYTLSCDGASSGCSTDVRGLILNEKTGVWYYGTAPDNGAGDFGSVTFTGTTASLHRLVTGVYAHGLTWDPYTQSIIVSSDHYIQQIAANGSIIGEYNNNTSGIEYDQTSSDGKGHLFAASNNGDLTFIDFSGQSSISNFGYENTQFLANNLDDIQPLSGYGSDPSLLPEPSTGTLMVIGLLAWMWADKSRRIN